MKRNLTRDEMFVYTDLCNQECRYGVRVWEQPDTPPVVMFSQLAGGYLGPSVTNRIEGLAWAVFVQTGQPAGGLTVVQHYPAREFDRRGRPRLPETFAVVTFARAPQGFSDPCWQPVSKEEVERLLGQPPAH